MAGEFLANSVVVNQRYVTRRNSVDNKLFLKKCEIRNLNVYELWKVIFLY